MPLPVSTGSRDVLEIPQLLRSGPIELHYDLNEESQVGFIVADLISDTKLHELLSPMNASQALEEAGTNPVQRLRFRYLNQPNCPLALDERSGLISVGGRIDREVICGREEKCQLRLDIVLQPMFVFRIFRVSISLVDINDHQPVFDPDHVYVLIDI